MGALQDALVKRQRDYTAAIERLRELAPSEIENEIYDLTFLLRGGPLMDATRPARPPRETTATRVAEADLSARVFAAAEAIVRYLMAPFAPAADFWLTDFCLQCRSLGLSAPEMQRLANWAYRSQRAAEVTA